MSDLARTRRGAALPLATAGAAADLAEACEATEAQVDRALDLLREDLAEGKRGVVLREVAGGFTLASDPAARSAARRLLAKPRTPPLTQAQAETLAIVAYLQPVSRPEIARIRGVSSESAVQTLAERGLIEESGRSRFGAAIFKTSPLFERLFGLAGLDALPDPSQFDPTPGGRARAARAPAASGRAAGRRELDLAACGSPSTSRTAASPRGATAESHRERPGHGRGRGRHRSGAGRRRGDDVRVDGEPGRRRGARGLGGEQAGRRGLDGARAGRAAGGGRAGRLPTRGSTRSAGSTPTRPG